MSTIEMDLIRALIGYRSGVVLLPKRATTTVYQHQVAQGGGGQLYLQLTLSPRSKVSAAGLRLPGSSSSDLA